MNTIPTHASLVHRWVALSLLGLALVTGCQDTPLVDEIASPSVAGEVDTPTPTGAPEGPTATPPGPTPSQLPTVTPTGTPIPPTGTPITPPTPTPTATATPLTPTPTLAPATATANPQTPDPATPTQAPATPTGAPTPTATPDPLSVDDDGDGFSELEEDCDDSDPDNAPGNPEICDGNDNNCDGDADEDAIDASTWYIDYDRDGYGGGAFTTESCTPPAGFVGSATDCSDINPTVNPGATEVCDGIDNNCDASVDGIDAQDAAVYYSDGDSDGYGVDALSMRACETPQGYAPNAGDCNDTDPQIHPGAEEPDCTDPKDYNCDGATGFVDHDGDGFAACLDCNDLQVTIYPGSEERCDGTDNNCDGTVDEDAATDATLWYLDGDQDSYGTSTLTERACSSPSGYVAQAGDCNDADPRYYPGASESDCTDPNDYSCDGSVAYADADGDGAAACVDCNDAQPLSYPGGSERCDGIDNDCDTEVDEASSTDASTWYPDADGDGYGVDDGATTACTAPLGAAPVSGDCDDTQPAYHPGAAEDSCASAEDFNCDGSSGYLDADQDAFSACEDCNDQNAQISPAAVETCNGVDDNCNGQTDEAGASNPSTWYADSDGDTHGNASVSVQACSAPTGYVASSDDCNDAAASAYPGATERCDGLDNDCDGSLDEGVQNTYYADPDGDGHGSISSATQACAAPSGYVSSSDDCAPVDASTYPGAPEGCDGLDHNCDGLMDQDGDEDGYPAATCGGTDCNDTLGSVHPGAEESCNGIDDDCDQITDENVKSTFYLDADGDSYGNVSRTTLACSAPTADYVDRAGDCNDLDPTVNPAATEICDNADNNCDTQVDESDPDIDFDSDVNHCGGCFQACSNASGEAACTSGECTIASCDPGWLNADNDPANGCEATYNYAASGGEAGANVCNFGTTWTRVPYNHTLSITTTGNPVLVTATKRQFKSGSCERGYLTLEIDGQIIQDASSIGIGSSYECYQSASLSWVQRLPAGNHTIRLMEKTDSSGIGVCSTGATDTMLALELTPIFNFAYAQGASGSNTRNGSTSWVQAPFNSQVSLTTAGNPILLMSTKRQYKDDCNSRGYLSFDLDGTVFQDAGGIGIGSSFSCNASAFASMVTPTASGTHTIKLVERGDSTSQGVYSMGTTDTLLALELEPWMNTSMARGQAGSLTTQYGTTWTKAPFNHTTQLTSEHGGHLLTYAVKRQYKAGSCGRGYFTLDIDGTVIRDEYDTGIGSSWNCNASAPLTYVRAADAGAHRLSLMERTESSSIGNQTYGATDNIMTWELVPQDGLVGTQARPAESCRQILKNGASRGSGAYWISTPSGARSLYCDMSVDGGGWTLVGQVSTGANNYDAWLKSERNISNLSSSLIEAGTWSSINAVPMAVQVATELRLSNSAISRWVRWPLPSGRTLSTWWNHAAGQLTIDAAPDQSVTVTAYSGTTATCYQSVYGIMPLVNHGGSYPSAAVNTAGNTATSDWCMSVGTMLSGTTGNGFSQNGNGWDAPYTETDWPNASFTVASPVISVWLR